MRYHGICKTLPFLFKKSSYEKEKEFESEKSLEGIMEQHIRDGHNVSLVSWSENSIKYIDYSLGCICIVTRL